MPRLAANPALLHQRTPPQLKMQMTGASAPSCSPRCPQLKPLFSSPPQTLFPNIILSVSFETRSRCFSRISAAKQRQQEAVKSDKKRTGRRRAPVKPPPDGEDAAIEAEAELQAPTVGRRSSSHPSHLPKPPAGFVLDARGKVLLVSNKRIATIVDATNNLPLECVIRRVFQSSRGDECMLLCPVDTPVQILKSTNFSGWAAVNDDEVEDILPSAAYALAKIHMHLVVSGFCYTARGGFCYSDDDIIEFCTDDGQEIDGLPTEGLEISCFNLDGVHYMIYTPSDPLLFVASKDENGMLQIADDDLLEDPAIVDAIDEETEFNALVEEEAALVESLLGDT